MFGEGSEVLGTGIVGYTTETLGGGKWLIAQVGFENVTGGEIDLQDLIQGIQTTNIEAARGYAGWKEGEAPRIQIQKRDANGNITGTGNTTYYYLANAILKSDRTNPVMAPGWANESGNRLGAKGTDYTGATAAEAIKVKPGTAFWYQDPADSTITFAGQVLNSNTVEVFVPAGQWGLVCNPFPMALSLNSVKISYEGLTTDIEAARGYAGWKEGDAPRIQIQKRDANGLVTGTGNTVYYYLANAILKSDRTSPIMAPGWANESGNRVGAEGTDYTDTPAAAAVTIPVGAGFWFQNPGTDCTITFTK